jgi:hypothetical protein
MFYYGIKGLDQISVIMIQTLLSAYFLGGLLKVFIFNYKNEKLLGELKTIFSQSNLKADIDKYAPHLVKLYVEYESNKSWSYIHLSNKIYKKYNSQFSKEWNEIKVNYNIK